MLPRSSGNSHLSTNMIKEIFLKRERKDECVHWHEKGTKKKKRNTHTHTHTESLESLFSAGSVQFVFHPNISWITHPIKSHQGISPSPTGERTERASRLSVRKNWPFPVCKDSEVPWKPREAHHQRLQNTRWDKHSMPRGNLPVARYYLQSCKQGAERWWSGVSCQSANWLKI